MFKNKNQFNRLNIIVAVELVTLGVCFLLVGLKVIPIKLSFFWLPMLLAFCGVALMSIAVLRKDNFAAWFCVPFLLSTVILIVIELTALKYSDIYPVFVALPGIASLCVLPFTKVRSPHIKSFAFFTGISLVLLMDVIAHLDWGIIIAALLIIVGVLLFLGALMHKGEDWDETVDTEDKIIAKNKKEDKK